MAGSLQLQTPTEKQLIFLEQFILLNGIRQTIRTDKETAFTGNEFRQMCKYFYMKLLYGIPYTHRATGLVERG